MSRKLTIEFPSRYDAMRAEINFYSKSKIKMILTSGVEWCVDEECYICAYCCKRCKNMGKHPVYDFFPKGSKSATCNKSILYKALKKHPESNLAIVVKGFTVLDVDDKSKMGWIKKLNIPKTRRVVTGRGYHYYFQGTPSFKPKPIEGIEVKTNGLITVPPSRHKSGKIYRRIS